ncbi:type VI secretion system-associated FHA domain protein TagH [Enterobacteriaceae bacterium 4M9]|nr:type VI secretion system-associated FHA domain protein TagH [Enterobacteriaceae bacterium 4M9]
MRLIVTRNKDNEKLPQSYCDFKTPGGTIGRGTDNTLILPDQTRAISRLQAVVHLSPGGECAITHRGSTTPLILNGRELAHNVQQPLAEGDVIDIGGYQFSVSLTYQSIPSTAMQTDMSAPVKHNIHEAVWDELEAEFTRFVAKPMPAAHLETDHPLYATGKSSATAADPLAQYEEVDLSTFLIKSSDPGHLFEQDETLARTTILNDTTPSVLLDLNTPEHEPEAPSAPAQTVWPPLFNPADAQAADWMRQDADIKSTPDPTDLFIDNAVPLTAALDDPPPPVSDGLEPLFTLMPEPEPDSAMLYVSPVPEAHSVPAPQAAQSSAPAVQPVVAPPEPLAHVPPPQPARMGVDPIRHQPFQHTKSCSQEQLHGELFSAFVDGLGLDDAPVAPDFSPEQLRLAGRLLSLFSQGTVALLSSRSILKRGLKAEMTMILEEENNPFKMLPSGKTVLMQIFSTPMPGFTPPESAVRDAMIDLQAHQLGMIAGVRAIIAAMLQTFHPDTLEKKAAEQPTNRGLFNGNHKAQLWDTLKAQYQQVANEVEDDFHTLFGEAFLHAYDIEVRQYKASQLRRESP